MRVLSYPLKFITPAFIAGANQNQPSIRAASIRGALRWWFRVLGGTKTEEDELFGFVRKTNGTSKVTIRVSDAKIVNNERDVPYSQNTIAGYLLYFAKVSGNDNDIHRTVARHYIGKESTFTLQIVEKFPISEDLWRTLELAINAFCIFGTLGLRSTRGYGKIALQQPKSLKEILSVVDKLSTLGVNIFIERNLSSGSASDVQCQLGAILKEKLRQRWKVKNGESALGNAQPRSTSALQLCPVVTSDKGILPFFLYTDNACAQASILDELRIVLRQCGYIDATQMNNV